MIDSSPANVRARELLENGRLAQARGDREAALVFLTDAAKIAPEAPHVLLPFANALLEAKSYEDAKAVYARILKANPKSARGHYGLARVARQMGDTKTALNHFRAAIDGGDVVDVGIRIAYAQTLLSLKELDEAEEQFRKILAENPQQYRVLFSLGRIARMRNEPQAALDWFKAAAEIDPDSQETQKEIADTLMFLGRIEGAEIVYRQILSQTPGQQSAVFGLLKILRQRGDWPGALQIAEAAKEAEPGNLKLRVEFANALRHLMRYDEAEPIYKQVLSGSPDDVDALCGLADIARVQGDIRTALWYMESAMRIAPGDASVREVTRDLSVENGSFDWKQELEAAVRIVRAGDAPAAKLLSAAAILFNYGITDIVHPALVPLEENWPGARKLALAIRELERAGLALSAGSEKTQPDPNEYQLEELKGFIEKPVANSDTMLLAFSGTNNRMSFTLSLMHRFLRKSGVSVVYVRDINRNRYLGGVVGLGNDFAETTQAFADLAKRYGAKRILTLGNCTGCLGALRYGAALGAEAILGISPALRAQRAGTIKPEHAKRLADLRGNLPANHKTLDTLFAEARQQPNVTLIYSEKYPQDAEDAQSTTAFSDVTLVPIPNAADHNGIGELLMRGLLAPLLSEFVSEGRVSAEMQTKIRTSAGS
jgi:tetratricopeptide (TPR) repeat protein